MNSQNIVFEHNGQTFSYREAQVLLCCANGYTAQQTADLLCVSYNTAKTHRENLRNRFGLQGHHSLARLANNLRPYLEKSVTLLIKIGNVTD